MTLGPGSMVGPYRLGPLLGRGGMAVVYEATHEEVGRVVALKLISPELVDPSFLERFAGEGRMQAALDHPNVVTVYEAGTSEYGPYLAMRLVRGTTLAGLIDGGSLTSQRTLKLLGEVASALDAAHARGLVHRDVKPRNILVGADDTAYLADFGLTRPSEGEEVSGTGHFMGTLAYSAPEVIAGEAPGPAADRYALAAVLFECLTGTPVFPRPTRTAVLYAHTYEPPPRVSGRREGIPVALDEVLIDGLAKHVDDRPRTAEDLVARARKALGGQDLAPPAPRLLAAETDDGETREEATVSSMPRAVPLRRARGGLIAAAVLGALVGGGIVALVTGGDDEPAERARQPVLAPVPAGTERLGASLTEGGRTIGCDGRPLTSRSPGCTIFQERLAGSTLIVPRNGVVRRWGVRGAQGELALTVMRRQDKGYFQITRSRNEFVDSDAAQAWPTELEVERGDRLGLVVIDGSGVGVETSASATTNRYIPALRGLVRTAKPGIGGELLLRADYAPGEHQRPPDKLTGAAAASAPAGKTLARDSGHFKDGLAFALRLVLVGDRGALDYFLDGRRVARVWVPELMPPAGVDASLAHVDYGDHRVGIDVKFTRLESARLLRRYVEFHDRKLAFFS